MLLLELRLLLGLHLRLGFGLWLVLESSVMAGDSFRFWPMVRIRSFLGFGLGYGERVIVRAIVRVMVLLDDDRARILAGPQLGFGLGLGLQLELGICLGFHLELELGLDQCQSSVVWLWVGLKIRNVVWVRGRVKVMTRASFRFRPISRVMVRSSVG